MADSPNTVDFERLAVTTQDGSSEQARNRQMVLVAGLSALGAIGVAWGVARGDPILAGLWIVYLLLAALFAYRAVR